MRLATMGLLGVSVWLLVYFSAVLMIKSMSLTWGGILAMPLVITALILFSIPWQWYKLSSERKVARHLEKRHPELQLSVRSSLDFLEGKTDHADSPFHEAYLDQVLQKLNLVYVDEKPKYSWGGYAFIATSLVVLFWLSFDASLLSKFYNPSLSFGKTHLDLSQGSITIFEPDYTQIPGRTLPLKPGTFQAYPGSRIRFMVQLPEDADALYLAQNDEENPIPLRINEEGQATHEIILMESVDLRFLVSQSSDSGRTEAYQFQTRVDEVPEIILRSYTPEGPINVMDPLIIEAEIKDDFGAKSLEAVVSWEGQEKRIDIAVPVDRKKHFLSRNQWYISDFDLPDVESFSIYLEATDNKPIGEPGITQSETLTYELESPDKKYDEFMELARELLDTMTHTLGDNLETYYARAQSTDVIHSAQTNGERIGTGLFNSLNLTNKLISKVRETPNFTRLDQSFLYEFRNGVSSQARSRTETNILFTTLADREIPNTYRRLVKQHQQEEIRLENLSYDLLLQLKMWAVLEMERQKNEMESDLDDMESLLENAENMESEELMKLFDKLMSEVMKDFQEMMEAAAEQMDMTMQEFMNSDAMKMQENALDDLKKQIMEALKEGDIEKAKKLMEELRAQMQEAMASMQQSMGEMSPEMQAMMKDMKELMGLLREMKTGEEELERLTQDLKRELDKEMGGNPAELTETQKEDHRKITEKIHEMLTELNDRMTGYKTEGMMEELVRDIAHSRERLENETLNPSESNQLRREINRQENILDFLTRDGLSRLQNMVLRNLDQTEKMQEYLDQNEYMLSLEAGSKLETSLVQGERMSEQTPSRQLQDEVKPAETFFQAREELYKILDALQNLRSNMEEQRRQHMEQKGEQRQQQLSQKQADLQKMIQEFMERAGETFDSTQIGDKLNDIAMTMKNAEQRLSGGKLEGGIQYEQATLQKIGEMMEQLQQSQQPSGKPGMNFMMGRRDGMQGDPSTEDIFIPESEKRATSDRVKDAIRKQLKKNLPDSYGKEIRKYYEKLMDQ